MEVGTIVMLVIIIVFIFGGTVFLVGKSVANGEKKKGDAAETPDQAGNDSAAK